MDSVVAQPRQQQQHGIGAQGLWRIFVRDSKTRMFHEAHKDCVTRAMVADTLRKMRAKPDDIKIMDIHRFVMLTPDEIDALLIETGAK